LVSASKLGCAQSGPGSINFGYQREESNCCSPVFAVLAGFHCSALRACALDSYGQGGTLSMNTFSDHEIGCLISGISMFLVYKANVS